VRAIAQLLSLSRNTVRTIIAQAGARAPPCVPRPTSKPWTRNCCAGFIRSARATQRVYEKLVEEEGVAVAYSTLTRRLRELGIETGSAVVYGIGAMSLMEKGGSCRRPA